MSALRKVKCPDCGKHVRVPYADNTEAALCPACGTRFDVAPAPLLGPLIVPTAAAVATAEEPLGHLGEDDLIPIERDAQTFFAQSSEAMPMPLPPAAIVQMPPLFPAGMPGATPPAMPQQVPDLRLLPVGVDVTSAGVTGDAGRTNGNGHSTPTISPAERDAAARAAASTYADHSRGHSVDLAAPERARALGRFGDAIEGDREYVITAEEMRAVMELRRPTGHPLWWLAGALVLMVLGFGLYLYSTGQFRPWEDDHRTELVELKAKAESLAGLGRLRDAHEAYASIEKVVAGRPIRDTELQELVRKAKSDQDRVYAMMLARQDAERRQLEANAREAEARAAIAVRAATAPPRVAVTPPVAPPNPAPVAPRPAEPQPVKPEPPPVPVRRVRAPLQPVANAEGLTDAQIGQAIQQGVDYLLAQFDNQRHVVRARERGDDAYFAGLNALVIYALLQSGQAITDARLNEKGDVMGPKIDALKRLPIDGHHATYARALRSTCLALYNRQQDLPTLLEDADWLIGTTDGGAYTYNGSYAERNNRSFGKTDGPWDNSNSQYGLLGVWSAIDAEPRVEVPLAYWKAVERHWTTQQGGDGQWGYHGGDNGRLTMTCAGIASLFVAHEYLEPPMTGGQVGRDPYGPALGKALEWFERGNNAVRVQDSAWWGYALYGIERVGLASGFKHFGRHDWYRELAAEVVSSQRNDGSWRSDTVNTAYALLFLARGRHPILMNKLRWDGYWANRPRDASMLSRFATRQLERPINWQVVNAANPWTDWTDSPVLYIASHEPPKLTESEVEKIRQFVRAGGMLFTHADASSPAFDLWAKQLAGRLFPQYEMTDLPADHAIYNVLFKPNPKPPLKAVSNGSRVLMLHSPADLALAWQQRQDRMFEGRDGAERRNIDPAGKAAKLAPFHLGTNIFIYAAGKRDLRNRLDSPIVTAPQERPVETVRMARLQYGGNWDPEPGAFERFANVFQRKTGYRLAIDMLKLSDLNADSAGTWQIVHLTGTARHVFTDAEAAALRTYVQAGGVVVIDPCGGPGVFDQELRNSLLLKAFPGHAPFGAPTTHPLLNPGLDGMEDVARPRVRQYTIEKLGHSTATPVLIDAGKGHVVVLPLDLTSGLLGTNTWSILGYEPTYAESLLKNIILWTMDGQATK